MASILSAGYPGQAAASVPRARMARAKPPLLLGALTLAITAAFLGYDVGLHPIGLWDESRVATNAIEMSQTGFSLITTYGFQPDLWNTKPPLAIWLIAGSIRLFGPCEWAVRLPSLIAAIATVGLVMGYSWRLSRNAFVALCAPMLLLFSTGFYGPHMAQTADYDALLCLFVTAYVLVLFEVVHRARPAPVLTIGAALLVALACLTKGVAGLIPGVGVAVYVIARGRWPRLFRSPWPLLGAALVLALVGGFYAGREIAKPGYLTAVVASELTGRYLHDILSHTHPIYYYVEVVFLMFSIGPAALVVFLAPFLRWPNNRSKAFLVYGACVGGAMFVIFSLSRTKIGWYIAPLYPLLSIMSAIVLNRLWRQALPRWAAGPPIWALGVAAAALLTSAVIHKTELLSQVENNPQSRYGLVFDQLHGAGYRHIRTLDGGVENDEGLVAYMPQLQFYSLAWRQRGMDVAPADPSTLRSPRSDQVIVTCDPRFLGQVRALGAALTSVPGCAAAAAS